MANLNNSLPRGQMLGDKAIEALSDVFANTVSSYKFLWTLAILEQIDISDEHVLSIEKLSNSMFRESAIPIYRYKLHFGFHDSMETHLKKLAEAPAVQKDFMLGNFDPETADKKLLSRTHREIARYVPHRWLQPFFQAFTGKRIHNPTRTESKAQEALTQFAEEFFDTENPPPYKLRDQTIILHPIWREYFKCNMEIIRCWALWHWTNYLQTRNPNIPAVANKIGFPESRESWREEREFWQRVMKKTPAAIRCIYTEDLLRPHDFHLDHYVPWSFIGHNRPWNVIPATMEANTQKSDRLPHKKYFNHFTALQHTAMTIWNQHFPRSFKDIIGAYCNDLQLIPEQLTDEVILKETLSKTIGPLIAIAESNSFEADWVYEPPATSPPAA